MKYTALELIYDPNGKLQAIRIGRSLVYAAVAIIAMLSGRHFFFSP